MVEAPGGRGHRVLPPLPRQDPGVPPAGATFLGSSTVSRLQRTCSARNMAALVSAAAPNAPGAARLPRHRTRPAHRNQCTLPTDDSCLGPHVPRESNAPVGGARLIWLQITD